VRELTAVLYEATNLAIEVVAKTFH